jgi:hypothetical protein
MTHLFIQLLNATIQDTESYIAFRQDVLIPWFYRGRTVPQGVGRAGEDSGPKENDHTLEEVQIIREIIVSTIGLLQQGTDITEDDAGTLEGHLRYLDVRAKEAAWHDEIRLQRGIPGDPSIGEWKHPDVVCYAAQDFLEYVRHEDSRAVWIFRCDGPGCGRWLISRRRRQADHYFCSERCWRRHRAGHNLGEKRGQRCT